MENEDRAEAMLENEDRAEAMLENEDRAEAMLENRDRIYRLLAELRIPYEKKEHEAVFTTEEAERLCTDLPGLKMKNLFVKDKKTGLFYLVMLQDDRRLDFKAFKKITGWKSPAFASPEELWEHLKLTPGSVTAFGLMNDEKHQVIVVLDQLISEAAPETPINYHPCVNTATIAISIHDFRRFLDYCGNPVLEEGTETH